MRRELGDFQTPAGLVDAVLGVLGPIGRRWPRVLEPTCGTGGFLRALLASPDPPREVIGVEVQEGHWREACAAAASAPPGVRAEVLRASLFDLDLRRDLAWRERSPLLVVGNPPWVTSAEVGRRGGDNRPARRNLKGLPGLQARTGASNFDLAEAVWIKLIEELADEQPTIALLCKTAAARSVLAFATRAGRPFHGAEIRGIDAPRWFGAAVGACLLRLTLGAGGAAVRVPVFGRLDADEPRSVIGFAEGSLIADAGALERWGFALGRCPITWRQGLKHDAADIMELRQDGPAGSLRNGLGEPVDVERAFIYPLVKGSDLRRPRGCGRAGP